MTGNINPQEEGDSQLTGDLPLVQQEELIMPDREEELADDILLDVVCFTCPYLFRCGPRAEHNPIDCVWLRDWLNENVEKFEEEFEYED